MSIEYIDWEPHTEAYKKDFHDFLLMLCYDPHDDNLFDTFDLPKDISGYKCARLYGYRLKWVCENYSKENYTWYRLDNTKFAVPDEIYAALILKYYDTNQSSRTFNPPL